LVREEDFYPNVPLPPGLTTVAIRKAIEYIERELSELVEIYFEQANVFSALVGIYGAKALDIHSVYEKNRHQDLAQQRFPDLRRKGSGANLTPELSLESKGSKRPWAVQSHYDHPGWYIVWRYLVDPTKSVAGLTVIIWRVDVVFVEKADWKYEGSTAGAEGGGRTHTFGLKNPALKLREKGVYKRSDVKIIGSKPVIVNGSGG
jgi:hypothetical protein